MSIRDLFAYPERSLWLLAVLALGFIVFVAAKQRRRILSEWKLLTSETLAFAKPVNRPIKTILIFLGLVFTVLALMGPQWGQKEQALKTEGLDMCIAVDISKSMLAEDISPSRLGQVKNQLTAFLPRLGGDRVTLVAFAGSAYVASPLTADYAALINYLSPLDPSFISNQATSIDMALHTCLRALKVSDETSPESLEWESSKLIAIVSDGEETLDSTSKVRERLVKLGIPVFSLAVGTKDGAKIPIRDERNQLKSYVQDRATGDDAITKLLDESLIKLAELTKGQVFYAENGLQAWNEFYEATKKYKRNSQDAGSKFSKEHRFQIPLFIAFVLLIWDFLMTEIKFPWNLFLFWRKSREPKK